MSDAKMGQVYEHNGHRLLLLARSHDRFNTVGWAVEDLTVTGWLGAPAWAGESPLTEKDAIDFVSDFALAESRLIANPGI